MAVSGVLRVIITARLLVVISCGPTEVGMSKGTVILFIWLLIGAAAAGQRGYFSSSKTVNCNTGATIALTVAAGALNYVGIDPTISCSLPKPSS
jgi:hypothetical protein